MPELIFDHDETCSAVEEVGGQRVPHQVGEDPPPDVCSFGEGP